MLCYACCAARQHLTVHVTCHEPWTWSGTARAVGGWQMADGSSQLPSAYAQNPGDVRRCPTASGRAIARASAKVCVCASTASLHNRQHRRLQFLCQGDPRLRGRQHTSGAPTPTASGLVLLNCSGSLLRASTDRACLPKSNLNLPLLERRQLVLLFSPLPACLSTSTLQT